jgi:hypothetical protein
MIGGVREETLTEAAKLGGKSTNKLLGFPLELRRKAGVRIR